MLKLKKIFLAMMVAALAVTGFVSCSDDDDDDDLPSSGPVSIVLKSDNTSVEAGSTTEVTSNISGVKFTSSDTSVAKVESSDGKTATVTAIKVGTVTITAAKGNDDDGKYEYSYATGTITITVTEVTTSYIINGKVVNVTSDGTKVTKATVDGSEATVSESNGTLTVTTGEGDSATTLTATVSNGTVDTSTVKVNGEAATTSKVVTDEEIASFAGTIYVNETATVLTANVTNSGTKIVIKQSTDSDGNAESSKVDITLPGISYSMGTSVMTVPSFTVEDVIISTKDSENYTLSLGTFSTTGTTADGEVKNVTGTSVEGTYIASTGKIDLKLVYKCGAMPLDLTDTYTNNWADSYDSEYKISDLVGNGYTFQTKSGPHTFTVASESEIVYTMKATARNMTFNHYITFTSQEVGKNVYLLTGYIHDDDPNTPATSGTSSVYRVEISDKNTILLLDSKKEARAKASWYGTYTGTWSIMGQDFPMTAIVAESTFYYQSSMMTGLYEYVSWIQDDNGNWVCCGHHKTAPTAISDAACTVTFDSSTGKGSFAVSAMAKMGAAELTRAETDTPLYTVSYTTEQGTAPSSVIVPENFVLTSSQLPSLTADGYTFNGWYDGDTKAEAKSYTVTSDVTLTAKWEIASSYFYGTYTGTWTIMNNDYPMTVIVAESTFYYSSSMMTGSYEYVGWEKDDSGNWVCCGSHDEGKATVADAACKVTFDASTGKGSFAVTAMPGFGAAELTKSSDSTEVPTTTTE